MRIIVMADSHGAGSVVMDIVEKNIFSADMFIHLGDGENDTLGVMEEHPEINLIRIRGNCDYSADLPVWQVIETVPGPDDRIVRMIAVHGHLHNVEYGTNELLRLARENDADIVLFGHTHCRCETEEDGVKLINPGSCARPRDGLPPSYAYIDISEWGILTGTVELTF